MRLEPTLDATPRHATRSTHEMHDTLRIRTRLALRARRLGVQRGERTDLTTRVICLPYGATPLLVQNRPREARVGPTSSQFSGHPRRGQTNGQPRKWSIGTVVRGAFAARGLVGLFAEGAPRLIVAGWGVGRPRRRKEGNGVLRLPTPQGEKNEQEPLECLPLSILVYI